MKLNLECGTLLRNGYLNINSNVPNGVDFKSLPPDTDFLVGSPVSLDSLVIGQAEEIIFNPFLNVVTPTDFPKTLKVWFDKLSNGGVLKVNFVELYRLSDEISTQRMPIDIAHSFIYGNVNQYKSLLITEMVTVLSQDIGFKVTSISNENVVVSMELTKNV